MAAENAGFGSRKAAPREINSKALSSSANRLVFAKRRLPFVFSLTPLRPVFAFFDPINYRSGLVGSVPGIPRHSQGRSGHLCMGDQALTGRHQCSLG